MLKILQKYTMQEVLLYTPHQGSRIAYVARLIFSEILQCTCTLTSSSAVFASATTAIRIQYGELPGGPPAWVIPASGFLEERHIRPVKPQVFSHLDLPCFFGVAQTSADLPFDLFAMCFFLAVRYEEYLPFEPDHHGRFPAKASIAYQCGFLDIPLIDRWAYRLADLIRERFPGFVAPKREYAFTPTIDIDLAWAYLGKPLWKNLAGIAGDCLRQNWYRLGIRFRVWRGKQPDSFDQFDFLDTLHREYQLQSSYFFLFSDSTSRKDPNVRPQHPGFRQLIRKLAQQAHPGLHPSYHTPEKTHRITREKAALEQVIGTELVRSRQHFIRFRLPETYRALQRAGIREDYSMGYPDASGYRASLARPFPWFDLENNAVGSLTLVPFQVMDVTLKQYLQLHPAQAIAHIAQLVQRTIEVNGHFVSIWHNSSFAPEWGWQDWEKVYRSLLHLASPPQQKKQQQEKLPSFPFL